VDPEILAFTCNWNGWSCIETAISSGMKCPKSLKIVKVSCLSGIHAGLILQALDFGADGIMLIGCEPGKCHFGSNNECISREYAKAQGILELLGLNKDRLTLLQLSAFDGQKFVTKATKFVENIRQLISDTTEISTVKPGERVQV
jgi:coenzyme F420-reducing hydrogenase delta subunit